MLSDVEEKTYEFGMLRALGFNKDNIIITIVVQAVFFSIPGLVTGLLLAGLLNVCARHLLFNMTNNSTTYWLSMGSIWIGCALGTVMPLVANVLPIQVALGKNLRASLDIYHRSADELTIKIRKLQNYGLSVPQFVAAIMLVVLGVLTYYVAPTAFLYRNYELFFLVLNGVLVMMILGLTYVSVLVLPALQTLLLNTVLCCARRDRKLKKIIAKNMEAHQKRNTKTAIMFAICLSFLIFAGSTFKMIGYLIKGGLETQVGADLYATIIDFTRCNSFIDEGPIAQYLQEQKDFDGAVVSWTFASTNMKYLMRKLKPKHWEQTYFSDYTGYKTVMTNIHGVQENFLEVTNLQYYLGNELDQDFLDEKERLGEDVVRLPNGKIDPIRLLYSDVGTGEDQKSVDPHDLVIDNFREEATGTYTKEIKAVVAEGYRDVLSLDTTRPARLCIGTRRNCKTAYKVNVRAMLTKVPGWLFTAYQTAQFMGQQLIAEDQYHDILEDFLNTYEGTREAFNELTQSYNFTYNNPKYKMWVKLSPNITEDRIEQIADGIRSYFRDDRTILIEQGAALKEVNSTLVLFDLFVGLVGAIALTLAFFLLLVSTTQNVRENVWEYGCLRAMGYTKAQGMRTFMYEQYAVVVSSLILGSAVGLIVASVVTAQFFLFTEVPFTLEFPKELLYVMTGMALVTTFIAVYVPVNEVNKRRVASTLKGLS